MGFTEAVQSGLSNYMTFAGRATRSAFWCWVLFEIITSIVANVLDARILLFPVLSVVVGLGLVLPSWAVAVRRLHDTGKSGWNLLWSLIPILGGLYLLYLYVQPSSPEANVYGPAPA